MNRSVLILALSCAATLSVNMVLVRRARMDLPVSIFGLLQMTMTSIGLLTYALIKKGRRAFHGFREDIPTALVIGLIACGITTGILTGITKSSATAGAVLLRTDIMFTMIIGWFVVAERFEWTDIVFLVVLAAGALIVMGLKFRELALDNPYNLYFIASAMGISVNAFLIKYRIKKMNWALLAWVNVTIQSLFYCAFTMLTHGGIAKSLHEHPGAIWWVVGASVWLVAYFLTYYESLERLPVWYVRVFLLTMPAYTIAMEYPLFGIVPTPMQLGGIVLVSIGVIGLALSRMHTETAAPALQKLSSRPSTDR